LNHSHHPGRNQRRQKLIDQFLGQANLGPQLIFGDTCSARLLNQGSDLVGIGDLSSFKPLSWGALIPATDGRCARKRTQTSPHYDATYKGSGGLTSNRVCLAP
jgi:hypothetical protein